MTVFLMFYLEVSVTSEVDSSIGSAPRMPRGFGT